MPILRHLRITACVWAMALIPAAATSSAAAEGTVFTHHQGRGDKAAYDFTLSARLKAKQEGGAQTDQGEVTLQMKCLAEFLKPLPRGNQKIRGQILSGTMKVKDEGGEQTLAVGNVVSTYQVSPRGEMQEHMLIAGDPPVLFFPGLYQMLGPEDAFLLGGAAVFPDRPLEKGDTWKGIARTQHPMTGETKEVPFQSVLLGEETYQGRICQKIRTTTRVSLEGSIPVPGTAAVADIEAKVSTQDTWRFDSERGLIMTAQGSQTTSGTARVHRGTEVLGTITTSAVINSRSVLTEFNGEKITGE